MLPLSRREEEEEEEERAIVGFDARSSKRGEENVVRVWWVCGEDDFLGCAVIRLWSCSYGLRSKDETRLKTC
jgi:hypothetical protein